jgi:predicted dehydrogenase
MRRIDRRQMLARSAAFVAGVHVGLAGRARGASVNDKLNIACVGVGGKGASDMHETSVGQNVVAICDIDEQRLAEAAKAFPGARQYVDWRRLLDQTDIDAVTVSTPDHMHAPIAISAMQLGKHVYCQKPLCHSVYEARQLTKAAEQYGVVTQMGIQHHSSSRFKTAVKLIQGGIIGKVLEAHSWTDRPGTYWTQAFPRPQGRDAVPSHIHWDHWLGVAPARDYLNDTYHPFKWRAFWDFGTGALGDMGCHGMDPVISALQLGPPSWVRAETSERFDDTAPAWSVIHYHFPGTVYTTDPFDMVWYDGGKRPSADRVGGAQIADRANGIVFVGDQGLLAVDYERMPVLLPQEQFADFKLIAEPEDNHYLQWTEACKGNGTTSTPFSYAGPMTETVLLGNLAVRSAKPIVWDSQKLEAVDTPEADAFIRRPYRAAWQITGLS